MVCHPIALGALALLVINDHVAKQVLPGLLTGKLSDVAGLIYFPLLLVGMVEVAGPLGGRLSRNALLRVAILVTAVVFALIKSVPAATEAWNEVLGLGQWLVSGGPLMSRSPHRTIGIADPSDLAALPALMVAWWIGRHQPNGTVPTRKPTGRPSPVALAVLLVAGAASLATSPARQSASVDYAEEIRLTPAQPAAVRYLRLGVVNRDTAHSMVLLASATSERREDDMTFVGDTEGVSVTLLGAHDGPPLSAHANYSGATLDVHDVCASECSLDVWVIARLDDPASVASDEEVRTKLEVSFFATGDEGTDDLNMELSLEKDADRSFDASPTVVAASTEGRIRVSSESPELTERLQIVLDAQQLQGSLGFPLVAEIWVDARDLDASDHPNAHDTHFSFESPFLADDPELGVWGPYSYLPVFGDDYEAPRRLDLLPLCEMGEHCAIDVTVQSTYDGSYNSPDWDPDNAPPGFVELEWLLTVRLEAYDGRMLGPELLTITGRD